MASGNIRKEAPFNQRQLLTGAFLVYLVYANLL